MKGESLFQHLVLRLSLAIFTLLSPFSGDVLAAIPDGGRAVDVRRLVTSGKETLSKLGDTPASWTVKCQTPDGLVVQINVVKDRERSSWKFSQILNGRQSRIASIIESNGIWHVSERGYDVKYRPFEAELHFPAAYLFLSMAEPRCVVDERQMASAVFQKQEGDRLFYHLPLPSENRKILENMVLEYETMVAKEPAFEEKPEVAKTIKQIRERLANGTPMVVQDKTGLLLQTEIQEMSITTEGFRWLATVDAESFKPETGVRWEDKSQPWPISDFENCIMVGHDPTFQPGSPRKLALDGYLLNLRNGELRRMPFRGYTSMIGCFLNNRHEVAITGVDPSAGPQMLKLNLMTGRTDPLTTDTPGVGINIIGELSPDGEKIATVHTLSGKGLLIFQIQLIDLKSRKVENLGEPSELGAPLSWLPDGSGLILKRYEKGKELKSVEKRILCRLDLDGKLTDLRPGDWPVVLRKQRKLLYEDSKIWYVCNLDGSNSELFADGLTGYGFPAVSPDENKLIFALYEKGKLPKFVEFEVGKSIGTPIKQGTGFSTTPVWR